MNVDSAATALGLLPFLAAGQTHVSEGPYKSQIEKGVKFLLKIQKADGALADIEQPMYSHGLATIALCEAYGLTHDSAVGSAAQSAIHFIERAQNKKTGGWRYSPETTATRRSSAGRSWLSRAQMAGLAVDTQAFEGARRWLASVKKSTRGGLYAYETFQEPTPSMTRRGAALRAVSRRTGR